MTSPAESALQVGSTVGSRSISGGSGASSSDAPANPDFDGKHPRGPGGRFAAKGSSSGPAGVPIPASVQADIRAFQKQMGLPQTGRFDARTNAAISRAASAKAGGGSGKKAAAAKLKAQRAAARKAATAARKTAAAQKKQAAAAAKAQKQSSKGVATAVNKLTVAQRALYRQRTGGTPPAGYQWTGQDRLVTAPGAVQAAANTSGAASVAAVLSGARYDDSPLSASTTDNWVARRGGLPPYVRAVARGIMKSGHATSESAAIEIAIGRIKDWAAGAGNVTEKTRAKAAAAVAHWEALKASAGGGHRDMPAGALLESGTAGALLPKAPVPHLYRRGNGALCSGCSQPASSLHHRAALVRQKRKRRQTGTRAAPDDKATAEQVDRHAAAVERQAHGTLVRLFEAQKAATLKRLTGRRGSQLVRKGKRAPAEQAPAGSTGPAAVDPAAVFDTAYWTAQTAQALTDVYGAAQALTTGRLGDTLHPGIPTPTSAAQSVADILRRRAETVGAQITRTTYAQIAQQITEGLEAGEHVDDLAARVGRVFDEAIGTRAQMIARTESIGALNQAADTYANALPSGTVAYKRWLAVHDTRTRPAHAAADGQQAAVGEPFVVGGFPLQHPGDPTAPPDDVINCRCTAIYVPRRLAAVPSVTA